MDLKFLKFVFSIFGSNLFGHKIFLAGTWPNVWVTSGIQRVHTLDRRHVPYPWMHLDGWKINPKESFFCLKLGRGALRKCFLLHSTFGTMKNSFKQTVFHIFIWNIFNGVLRWHNKRFNVLGSMAQLEGILYAYFFEGGSGKLCLFIGVRTFPLLRSSHKNPLIHNNPHDLHRFGSW